MAKIAVDAAHVLVTDEASSTDIAAHPKSRKITFGEKLKDEVRVEAFERINIEFTVTSQASGKPVVVR